jgi:hypothetical protein
VTICRVRTLVAGMVAAFGLVAGNASAAPARDALIRPGVGIGEIRVGMTFAQVRRALGRPETVMRQRPYGFGGRYAEYAWNGTDWIVAVAGRGDRARVVSVATGLRGERTRIRRVGVGSTEEAVRRGLGARCFGKEARVDPITGEKVYSPTVGKDTMTCFLGRTQKAPHTTFSLVEQCRIPAPHPMKCPGEQRVYRVYEVKVGEPRFIWGYWG